MKYLIIEGQEYEKDSSYYNYHMNDVMREIECSIFYILNQVKNLIYKNIL
jgi:hypothetical protein